ncbi:MAG: acyltransferase [Desulfobacterales bacterium]|nr:acyltransferase [Desulfobacterales bacterium]
MLSFLPGLVRGVLSIFMYFINTILIPIQVIPVALLKLIVPINAWRKLCNRIINGIVTNWVYLNNLNLRLMHKVRWDVSGIEDLKSNEWYLVVANHQSWVDILVLQNIFHRKIPFLKFFMKKQIIWVPIIGLTCWALDFPIMRRYSDAHLQKHPHLRGKDIETTRKACEKFKTTPVSIMNFLEGTRFTSEKHREQQSPYTNLLKPSAGGIAFVLYAMGEQLNRILDVTIVYPQGAKSFWAFIFGKVSEIKIRVQSFPIDKEIIGDYSQDIEFRKLFQTWLNTFWAEKDKRITALLD